MDEKNTRVLAWVAWITSFGLLVMWSQPSARLVITLLVIAILYFCIRVFIKE